MSFAVELIPTPQSGAASQSIVPASGYLDWTQRSEGILETISRAFDSIASQSVSGWGFYNGSEGYGMCGVDEYALMKKIIQEAPSSQKDFYALDLGARNFEWSRGLAKFIDRQTDLPEGIKLNIIGLRAERYLGEKVIETDRCKIYNLGAFKIEEIFAKFKEQGLELENKVDLAVTRWCFRHLVDPVGTFAQTYNLLRPQAGLFLFDGFFFAQGQEDTLLCNNNIRMTQLLVDTQAPFLTNFYDSGRSLNHFILRRPDAAPCRLPMQYLGTSYIGDRWQVGSQQMTRFKREAQEEDKETFHVPYDCGQFYGDRRIHDRLKQMGVISGASVWRALYEKDKHLEFPPLHQAVKAGDRQKAQEYLDRGDDLNESDSNGYTPLHWAAQKADIALVTLLLERGADFGLANHKKLTPLHEAAISDTEGKVLQALIKSGANINGRVSYGKTALSCALDAENLMAAEILIKAGAEMSKENYQILDKSAFSSLYTRGILSVICDSRGGLADLHSWIKRGACVVLHYHGVHGIMYDYTNPENQARTLIIVDVNPESHLLDEGEWPSSLADGGYSYKPYDSEVAKESRFAKVHSFCFGY